MKKITTLNTETVTSGDRLRIAREKLGITQEQLAEILGCQCITIGRYERNESPKGFVKNADKLAEILNVNVDWLLGKSEYKTSFEKKFSMFENGMELAKSFSKYINILKEVISYSNYDIETQSNENIIKGYEIKKDGAVVGFFSVEDFNTMAFEMIDYIDMYIMHFLKRNNPVKTKKSLDKIIENSPTLTLLGDFVSECIPDEKFIPDLKKEMHELIKEEVSDNGNHNPTNQ